jgi:general secretion pathway protein D
MKKVIHIVLFTVLTFSCAAFSKKEEIAPVEAYTAKDCMPPVAPASENEELITMNYQKEKLVDIINFFAEKKNVNIIFPPGMDTMVTFSLEKKVTLHEAWNVLHTILGLAEYRLVERNGFYKIVKLSKDIAREAAPMYVGVPAAYLPNNNQPIWYVHFFSNLRVGEGLGEIEALLGAGGVLPENSNFRTDPTTNAVIIMAPANSIKNVLPLFNELDKAQFQEIVEILPLHFADATTVSNLFNNHIFPAIGAMDPTRSRLDVQRAQDSFYFSRSVRVVADPAANSVTLIGRSQAVHRIKEFIQEYLDKELETGKSPYHIYQLRYLAAEDVALVLEKVVNSSGSASQAKTESAGNKSQRLISGDIKIMTDKPINSQSSSSGALSEADGSIYQGGNRLIVACSGDDWKQIKDLLYKIDQPQPQVLLEVLVADLTIDDIKQLGGMIRNPARFPMPNGVTFQSAQLDGGVLPNSFANPQTIGFLEKPEVISSDLLRLAFDKNLAKTDDGVNSMAAFAPAGATVVSLNDSSGSTWGILQLLKLFDYTKVISHPHLIATHNQPAIFEIGSTRQVVGEASLNTTTGSIKIDTIRASLKINMVPRIIGVSDVVNIQFKINIDDFRGVNNTRVTREVSANFNVYDNDILALGGLLRENSDNTLRATPLLEKIPVLGWFVKDRTNSVIKTNLTVFISPTIIKPRLRRGIGDYSRDYVASIKEDLRTQSLFDTLYDPITRWFFNEPNDIDYDVRAIDEFLLKGNFPEDTDFTNNIDKIGYTTSSSVAKVENTEDEEQVEPLIDNKQLEQFKTLVQNDDKEILKCFGCS